MLLMIIIVRPSLLALRMAADAERYLAELSNLCRSDLNLPATVKDMRLIHPMGNVRWK